MQEIINVFSDNKIVILAIAIFIFGLVLLGYLLTLILSSKKHPKKVSKEVIKDNTIKENIDVKTSNELEEMLDKMQKTIEKKEEMDAVGNYEFEQEESSIISYQELLAAAKKDFPQISTTKVENIVEEKEIIKEELKPEILEVEEPKENKKFKNSVFISPIYGIAEKENIAEIKKDYFKTITDTKNSKVDINLNNSEDLEYENEINEKFVEDLKTFRNNL